jgi:hypothetical protein
MLSLLFLALLSTVSLDGAVDFRPSDSRVGELGPSVSRDPTLEALDPGMGLSYLDWGRILPEAGLIYPEAKLVCADTGLLYPGAGLLFPDVGLLYPGSGLLGPGLGLPWSRVAVLRSGGGMCSGWGVGVRGGASFSTTSLLHFTPLPSGVMTPSLLHFTPLPSGVMT